MSRNAKRIPVLIVNPPTGKREKTSLAHARRYVQRGVAVWTEGGMLRFVCRREAPELHNSPTIGRIVTRMVDEYSGHDSGFSTAAYPPASQSTGLRFPTLSRQGAGL